jgi:hypothetical protein
MGSETLSAGTRHFPSIWTEDSSMTTDNVAAFDASIRALALPGGKMEQTAVYETLITRPITKVFLLLLHLPIFLERFTDRERPEMNINKAGK